MNDFVFYLGIGWHHIISIDAADHILFLMSITAVFLVKDYKKILVLITAFTLGHCLTLLMSGFDLIRFSNRWVEFLIPLTIVISASKNIAFENKKYNHQILDYWLVFGFGLIHGMGFANYIRMMMFENENVAFPLFSFNVGLEVGQIVVVMVILGLSYLWKEQFKLRQNLWVILISTISVLSGIYLCISRLPF